MCGGGGEPVSWELSDMSLWSGECEWGPWWLVLYSDNCDGDRRDWGDLDLGVDGQLPGSNGYSFELSEYTQNKKLFFLANRFCKKRWANILETKYYTFIRWSFLRSSLGPIIGRRWSFLFLWYQTTMLTRNRVHLRNRIDTVHQRSKNIKFEKKWEKNA